MFSTSVCEEIQSYVYFLRDPRDDEVFYVGKGRGNRIFQHAEGKLESPTLSDKLDRIRAIQDSGESVNLWILRHGLSEEEAFEVEASLIDFIGLSNLTNVQGGRHSTDRGLKTPDELTAMYGAEDFSTSEPVLLFVLNKQYRRDMSPDELYEATRKYWVINEERRNNAKYAIATYRGITREVYEIFEWDQLPYEGNLRWGFTGQLAPDEVRDRLRGKSIAKYVERGRQWPIIYYVPSRSEGSR